MERWGVFGGGGDGVYKKLGEGGRGEGMEVN
jgi:hypothetical protein